jgi:hypothetical protein
MSSRWAPRLQLSFARNLNSASCSKTKIVCLIPGFNSSLAFSLRAGYTFRAEIYMQQPKWFPGECAHIPGQNVTLFVYLDPVPDWARKHFSSAMSPIAAG